MTEPAGTHLFATDDYGDRRCMFCDCLASDPDVALPCDDHLASAE